MSISRDYISLIITDVFRLAQRERERSEGEVLQNDHLHLPVNDAVIEAYHELFTGR